MLVVLLVFGSYLYVCINWFYLYFDEVFFLFCIVNYKFFNCFYINSDGDLYVYMLVVDKVYF